MWKNMVLPDEIMCNQLESPCSYFLSIKNSTENGLNFTAAGTKCFLCNNGLLYQVFIFVSQFLFPLIDCKPPKSPK